MSDYGAPPPPPYGAMPPGGPNWANPPDSYLVWAILSTILCCLPLGIVSIVFAAQVNGKWAQGDVVGAQEASRRARLFAVWSAVLGVAGIVLGGLLTVALGLGAVSTSP